jgi:hypothetical protein
LGRVACPKTIFEVETGKKLLLKLETGKNVVKLQGSIYYFSRDLLPPCL